jgi:FlaG/FlaF family flagellin (archaellin)
MILMKKIYKRMEPAVSPVIGVLLMLVVTIIIAAIVSGFAGVWPVVRKKHHKQQYRLKS